MISAYNKEQGFVATVSTETHVNSALFCSWLRYFLLPKIGAGYTLILDNASFHHTQSVRNVVEEFGCYLLFLPTYSPDFNPIENQWGNLKNRVKKTRDNYKKIRNCIQDSLFYLEKNYILNR